MTNRTLRQLRQAPLETGRPDRDRAAVATTAILQIVAIAPQHLRRQAVEAYLRDEIWDIDQQVAADRSRSDA
jgi:hypothetical protein